MQSKLADDGRVPASFGLMRIRKREVGRGWRLEEGDGVCGGVGA